MMYYILIGIVLTMVYDQIFSSGGEKGLKEYGILTIILFVLLWPLILLGLILTIIGVKQGWKIKDDEN